jgi:isopenicillin N synthase-like dioxygenase
MADVIREGSIEGFSDFDNRASAPVERAALNAVPAIDISAFGKGGTEEQKRRVAAQLRRACMDIGFFYLTGHDIPAEELDEAIRRGHELFGLPKEELARLHKDNSPYGLGHVPSGGTQPGYDKAPDTREVFSMTRERLPGEPEGGRNWSGHTLWPDEKLLPGFKAFTQKHIERRVALTRHLLKAFAMSLELPADWFDRSHDFLVCNLVYNYYPALDPAKVDRTQWGISPHTDYGSFTLLSQDDLGGLEIRNSAGEWIQVPPRRGAFVVNIGDLFARWTNDLYVSTLHRAVNYNRGARISLPLFVIPRFDVSVECIETCRSRDNPARYEPVGAGEYVRTLLEQSRRTGRAGISTQAAARFKTQGGGNSP